jgi:hypothetical protein
MICPVMQCRVTHFKYDMLSLVQHIAIVDEVSDSQKKRSVQELSLGRGRSHSDTEDFTTRGCSDGEHDAVGADDPHFEHSSSTTASSDDDFSEAVCMQEQMSTE